MTCDPLFSSSPAAAGERVCVPLGAPPSWLAAVAAADWQCQWTDKNGAARCPHRGRGVSPWRLYLVPTGTGPAVLCESHAGKHRGGSKDARRTAVDQPEPLF